MVRVSKLLFAFLLIGTIGVTLGQLEFVSTVFRVSPYGDCGSGSNLRTDAPCFASTRYDFYNVTTTGRSIQSIVSIPVASLGATLHFLGMDNNQIWVVSEKGSAFLFLQYAAAPASNWAFAFTDAANSYVAFVNTATTGSLVVKYNISTNGTLYTPPATITIGASGVNSVSNVIFREPLAWIAGGTSIAEVNLNTLAVDMVTDASTTITGVGNIQCGSASSSSTPNILYATASGYVFLYSSSAHTVSATAITTTESFATACGGRPEYAVFFASATNRLYQVNFPSGTSTTISTTPNYILNYIGIGATTFPTAVVNSDQSGLYLFTSTPTGTIPDTIYEFFLTSTNVDFSSVIQPTSPTEDNAYHNVYGVSLYSTNVISIATSYVNSPHIYSFNIPSTLTPLNSSLLYANYAITTNPTGDNGKTNAIADVGKTAGNGDIIFGNGVPKVSGNPPNSTAAISPRGPITTYLRGTKSSAPSHGGAANTDASLNLHLVSLDEVSTPAVFKNGSSLNLVRSMPFYDVDTAPWWQWQTFKPDGVTITGYQWKVGITDNPGDAAHQYSYLIPPYPSITNNTESAPVTGKRNADEFTNGYVSFFVTQDVFLQNTSMIGLNNITQNVTTRTFRYQFSIYGWPFLSTTNYLRLNLMLNIGPDGNGTISAGPGDFNGTTPNPIVKAYLITADSADWVLSLPQNLQQTGTASGFADAPQPCVYDPSKNLVSIFFPYSNNAVYGKSANQTYTLLLDYSYDTPPLPAPSLQDGGGPHLLPLWIVLGVLGGIVIIGIIVAIIVIIVVYRLVWKNTEEYNQRTTFDKTENALDRDKGF